MRFHKGRALSLAALGILGIAWSGCEAKQQTEFVAGVSTQVKVPKDLKAVSVSVAVGGARTFCRAYRVYDGKVLLPRSLGTYALNDPAQSGPITYTIIGYTTGLAEGDDLNEEICNNTVGQNDARILRRSRQPYVPNEILFLPLPLKYSCFDVKCDGEEKTCKGGLCVDPTMDVSQLPQYKPELVDGTGGECFRASECVGAAGLAAVVNPDDCTYAVPNTPSAPPRIEGAPPDPFPAGGEGLNVVVTYDGGASQEILDKDNVEGFLVPDPSKPQQFRLAPGLCAMVHGVTPEGTPTAHRITNVRTSGVCRSKTLTQPICAGDALAIMGVDPQGVAPAEVPDKCSSSELKPPKAVLMVVVDDTSKHKAFFDEAGPATLGISLGDPAFQRTDIGLMYTPGAGNCAVAGSFVPAVPPEAASSAKTKISASFTTRAAAPLVDVPVNLGGALRDSNAILTQAKYDGYFRRAVLFIGNREFGSNTCTGTTPATIAEAGRNTPGKRIDTYVIDLARAPTDPPAPAAPAALDPAAFELASKGGTGAPADARGDNKANAKDAFQRIVESLATCVYDVDANSTAELEKVPVAGDILSYTDPVLGQAKKIAHDPTCVSEGGAGNGWGFDGTFNQAGKKRIVVCGQACTDYRSVLKTTSDVSAAYLQPPPPIPIFSNKKGCEPK